MRASTQLCPVGSAAERSLRSRNTTCLGEDKEAAKRYLPSRAAKHRDARKAWGSLTHPRTSPSD
eukprot:4306543-Amphidinium_carterae.1